jgi:hypothetical protein
MATTKRPELGKPIYYISMHPVVIKGDAPEGIEKLIRDGKIKDHQVLTAQYASKEEIMVESLRFDRDDRDVIVINDGIPGMNTIHFNTKIDLPSKMKEDRFFSDDKEADAFCEKVAIAAADAIEELQSFLEDQKGYLKQLIESGTY